MYYYFHRDLSSIQRRFTAPDPAEPDIYNPISYNEYLAFQNNPIKYNDPYGELVTAKDDVLEYRTTDGKKEIIIMNSVSDLEREFEKVKTKRVKIKEFRILSHGMVVDNPGNMPDEGRGIMIRKDILTTNFNYTEFLRRSNKQYKSYKVIDINQYKDTIKNIFDPRATIKIEACYSADRYSIGPWFKSILPLAKIYGYTKTAHRLPIGNFSFRFYDEIKEGSKWVQLTDIIFSNNKIIDVIYTNQGIITFQKNEGQPLLKIKK